MAYDGEIIKIPATHIRQNYTNDIVISNFIKQVNGTINSVSMPNSEVYSDTITIYELKDSQNGTYTYDLDDYNNVISDNSITVIRQNVQTALEKLTTVGYIRHYTYVEANATFDTYSLYQNIKFKIQYSFMWAEWESPQNASYGGLDEFDFSISSDNVTSPDTDIRLGTDDVSKGFRFAIAKFASVEDFEANVFEQGRVKDRYRYCSYICGLIANPTSMDTDKQSFRLRLVLKTYQTQYNYSDSGTTSSTPEIYFSYQTAVNMDILSTEEVELNIGDSAYAYDVESNELMHSELNFSDMANTIIENRSNGLMTAEISTAILQYKDIFDDVIIDPEAADKEHLFKQGMFVQPWINATTPLAYTKTDEPMIFYINSVDFDFNGVGKQNLKLLEVPNVSYVNVTIFYGEGIASVKIGNTTILSGGAIRVKSGMSIYVRVEYVEDELDNVYYQPNTGQGSHHIVSDTVINVTAIKSTRIYEGGLSNISTSGCSISSAASGGFEITPTSNDYYYFSTSAYDFDDNKSYEIIIEGLHPLVDYTSIDGTISVVADSTSFGGIRELSDITFESNNPVDWSLQFSGDSEYDFNMISFTCPPNAIAFTRMYIIEQTTT